MIDRFCHQRTSCSIEFFTQFSAKKSVK
uniref:Uncharacterized protein n=1 Tax=Arundo donax TaxID=35708 RepID=A0A0A9B3I5_ARUDO